MNRFKLSVMKSLIAMSCLVTMSGHAADLHLLATTAMKPALEHIAPDFENATGHRVSFAWGASSGAASSALSTRMKNGETFDVAIMLAGSLDEQIKFGFLQASGKAIIASSRIGLAVRPGLNQPDISTMDSLKQTLIAAKSVAFSSGVSGIYVAGTLFPKLGLLKELKQKSIQVEAPELVGHALLRKEADIGLQQMSELLAVPGIQIVGPLPEAAQRINYLAAAVSKNSKHPQVALAFIDFLKTPQTINKLTAAGFDPITP